MGTYMQAAKPGWKTTEFWLTLLASLAGAAIASGVIGEGSQVGEILGTIVIGLSNLGYGVSRGLTKGVK